MKGHAVLALFLLIAVATALVVIEPVNASGDYWVTRAPIPVATDIYGVTALNGQIYVFGANANGEAVTYDYNPNNYSWTTKAPMPTSRSGYAVVAYQNKIYTVGGDAGENEAYDPGTNTWSSKAFMPLNVTEINAIAVNGKIYVISGYMAPKRGFPEGLLSSDIQIYDPATDNWTIAASQIPTPVRDYASGVINAKIYVAGGSSGTDDGTNQLQIYDPKTDLWTSGAYLPEKVSRASGAATLGLYSTKSLYVVGGWNGGPALGFNQIYNAQTQNWTLGTPFPTTHNYITQSITAASINDTIYVIGGLAHSNEGYYEINEQYIPMDYNGTIAPSPTSPSPAVPEFGIGLVSVLLIITLAAMVTLIKRNDCTVCGHAK